MVHIYADINPLTPGSFEWNFIKVMFKLTHVIDGWGISCPDMNTNVPY